MSLDVYLTSQVVVASPSAGIFVREDGCMKELTRAEWDERNPGREPVVCKADEESNELYWRNITHNLSAMAREAGVYEPLWRPDEIGISKAAQLVEPLKAGLEKLRSEPDRFKALNPKNGWGDYEGLVNFVADYLAACERHPDAEVRVSR